MSAPPDPRWLSSFLEAQLAEAGAARNTVLGYGRDLNDFAAFLRRNPCISSASRRPISKPI